MKLSEEKELAHSNSQLEYHNSNLKVKVEENSVQLSDYIVKFGYLGCYIDRLTIVGNLTDQLENILLDYDSEINYYHSNFFKGQLFANSEGNFFIEHDLEKARKMGIRDFRLEFNPRLSRHEQMEFIERFVIPNLNNVSISRIDIAFDFERDLSNYVIDKAISRRVYFGKDNKVETIYWGSPKSEYQIRIYDKYKERKKKGTDYDKYYYGSFDCYWRMEFQLNGSKFIEKQIRNDFHVLQETKITKRNYAVQDLSTQEQIFLFVKDKSPELFSQLGKASKAKYNKLAKDISEVDLSDGFRLAIQNIEYCYDVPQKVSLVDFCKKILED